MIRTYIQLIQSWHPLDSMNFRMAQRLMTDPIVWNR